MNLEHYYKQRQVSRNLYRAILIQWEISDLLGSEDPAKDIDLGIWCGKAEAASKELTKFEAFVVGGVAKALWRDRVHYESEPLTHPEHHSRMHAEYYTYMEGVHDFNDLEQQIAQSIIDETSVDNNAVPRQPDLLVA